ncbi:MAG TPA: acetyl-CoA decarbonylase/synthase complex subunit gamma [Oscillospiraceae bacterium]|nr:acetyl-CoA decarbonylase/synthase complex subunit gamma [Oscillospiraceae bacterium]HPS34785.1 acetyl-CoA decarbonylase/synthase complex subunit gamma [Oscillospiraceae bacterium]
MALNGLEIQKLLPKTNCKECGSNTCLAFAMKLAAKKANLSECPYASEEAKNVLGADSEPPVKSVTVGTAKLGEETVLYRHEKTFVHQPLLAVNVDEGSADAAEIFAEIKKYKLERVGEVLTIGCVAVTQKGSDEQAYAAFAKTAGEATGLPVIIRASTTEAAGAAAAALKGTHGVICGVNMQNADDMTAIAKENTFNLAVAAGSVDEAAQVTAYLKGKSFNELLIQYKTDSLAEQYQTNTIARRAAIKDKVKALGYAGLKFIETDDLFASARQAVTETDKYGGIIVLPTFSKAQMALLMTLRQNIYTDPQKPIQVEPKIYAIGEPNRNSEVFVTTNFSLTYFLVSGEIENSGISAYLVVPECEGMSVLTAWAAGKFSGTIIAKFAKENGLEDLVDTRRIVIPGYVSQISGELEENLPGWKVLVGPQEAGDIQGFIKAVLGK